ncbi:MAG: 4-hydroxythreonine-4-phosphate dehydrogenase PdxA [Oceanipulchritudo sp.]
MKRLLPIALTCGDPAGVGPEIIRKWLDEDPTRAGRVCPIGSEPWLQSLPAEGLVCPSGKQLFAPGSPTPEGARVSWEALEIAARGCLEGRFRAVVTGPVNKHQLASVGYPFPGQTEFFANSWGGVPSMAFSCERLKVVLVTWHVSLATVPRQLAEEPDLLDRAIVHAVEWGNRTGLAEPRIAVCGLNPHAGEGGLLGSEEKDLLNPRLKVLRGLYPGVSDCLPADTVFHRLLAGEFDLAVALYHDQGLIPVKTLGFHTAVNLTLGLRHFRASPDHGTAYAIAGKGIARTGSFAAAVELADRYTQLPFQVER